MSPKTPKLGQVGAVPATVRVVVTQRGLDSVARQQAHRGDGGHQTTAGQVLLNLEQGPIQP